MWNASSSYRRGRASRSASPDGTEPAHQGGSRSKPTSPSSLTSHAAAGATTPTAAEAAAAAAAATTTAAAAAAGSGGGGADSVAGMFPDAVPMLPKVFVEVSRLGGAVSARLANLLVYGPVEKQSGAHAALDGAVSSVADWGAWLVFHGAHGPKLPRSSKTDNPPEVIAASLALLSTFEWVAAALVAAGWALHEAASAAAAAGSWLSPPPQAASRAQSALMDGPGEIKAMLESVMGALKLVLRKEARLAGCVVAEFRKSGRERAVLDMVADFVAELAP